MTDDSSVTKDNIGLAVIHEKLTRMEEDLREIKDDNKERFKMYVTRLELELVEKDLNLFKKEMRLYKVILYGIVSFFALGVGGFILSTISNILTRNTT